MSPKGTAASVAAVVVNFNAATHLRACVTSLASNGADPVVVVDNASTDGSRYIVEDSTARWIPAGRNLGYGRAANLGAADREARKADYLLICNPDVELLEGALSAMVSALERDELLGAVGPHLWNEDGTLYPSARTFPDLVDAVGHGLFGMIAPRNRFTRRYRMLDWDHREAGRVDWISGACFLIRRSAWDQVGGFDPSYFMYLEDVDLCWRLGEAGWLIGYEPSADVTHTQGVSTDRHPYRMLAAHHHSLWRFAWRTTRGRKRLALPLVAAGLGGRLAVAAADHRFGRSSKPSTGARNTSIPASPPRPLP